MQLYQLLPTGLEEPISTKPPIKEIIVPYEVPVFISEYLLSNKSLMHNIAKFAKLRILEARLAWRTLKGSSRGEIRTA